MEAFTADVNRDTPEMDFSVQVHMHNTDILGNFQYTGSYLNLLLF